MKPVGLSVKKLLWVLGLVATAYAAALLVLFVTLLAVELMPAGIAQRLGYAAWLGWLCVASLGTRGDA